MRDTIFALATAPGRAALAVVRISGAGAAEAATALCGRLPAPRVVSVRLLVDPVSRETLDQALVVYMPGPASFTGEDVVELHVHGGRAVTASVLSALDALPLRPAEPGEFTRRAFEGGRIDLVEAEAIADLVDAESAAQRRQALAQLRGGSLVIQGWRAALIEALAFLEAAIDFPDEDLPDAVGSRAAGTLGRLLAEISDAACDLRGERVREGYRIALIGAPNGGKSSLLNQLLRRDAAIVSDLPGTTRDVIEQTLDLGGYRVLLADTAGLRPTPQKIEAEGIRRARAWAEAADLRLWVVDSAGDDGAWRQGVAEVRQGDLAVFNKADLPWGPDGAAARDAADALELEPVFTTTLEADGAAELRAALERRVVRALGGEPPPATRLRHRRLLGEAAAHLRRALDQGGGDPELMAEDVRLAARALEALTGRVDADAVLDEVFSSFCIGK